MKTIYLALAEYDREGYHVIRAFDFAEAAEAFIEPMRTHMQMRPPYPPLHYPSDSPEWAEYMVQAEKWEEAAPPGFERGDGYSVMAVELYPSQQRGAV